MGDKQITGWKTIVWSDRLGYMNEKITEPYWIPYEDVEKIITGKVKKIWKKDSGSYEEWKHTDEDGNLVIASSTTDSTSKPTTEIPVSSKDTIIIDVSKQPTRRR